MSAMKTPLPEIGLKDPPEGEVQRIFITAARTVLFTADHALSGTSSIFGEDVPACNVSRGAETVLTGGDVGKEEVFFVFESLLVDDLTDGEVLLAGSVFRGIEEAVEEVVVV